MSPPIPTNGAILAIPGYELDCEIIQGGAAVIYRARHLAAGHEVAIKVIQHGFENPDTCRRFTHTARIMAQLQHPSVPPVSDLGTLPDGRPYLVMKLIKGRALDQLLTDRPNPAHDREWFVSIFEQVCLAVAYAHARRVIHRDLKAQNVVIGPFGEVQVMDWELATTLESPEPPSVVGTPAYMPPEQARGEPADERSDVFALGGILCHILTDEPPFRGENAGDVIQRAVAGDMADAFARLDTCGADSELIALCKRCLSPNPSGRPAHSGEVAFAISQYTGRAGERARHADVDRALAAERRKRRTVLIASAVTVVLCLTVAIVAVLGK